MSVCKPCRESCERVVVYSMVGHASRDCSSGREFRSALNVKETRLLSERFKLKPEELPEASAIFLDAAEECKSPAREAVKQLLHIACRAPLTDDEMRAAREYRNAQRQLSHASASAPRAQHEQSAPSSTPFNETNPELQPNQEAVSTSTETTESGPRAEVSERDRKHRLSSSPVKDSERETSRRRRQEPYSPFQVPCDTR